MASEAAPATTRVTTRATTRAHRVKKAKCVGHLSMLDADALNLVLVAFLNLQPFSLKELIKRLTTLREINKNWAEVFARQLYDKTAAVLYTSQMCKVDLDDSGMSRNDAINSACATSLNTMGYLMYNQVKAYLPPSVCWATIKMLGRFADANNAEILRLVGLGVGLPADEVTGVVNTNFPANAQGAQAEEETDEEEEEDVEDEENA